MNFATAVERLLVWALTAFAALAAFAALQLWSLVGEVGKVNVNIATMLEKMSAADARTARNENQLARMEAHQVLQDEKISAIQMTLASHAQSDARKFMRLEK
jgi:hypothetical protein